MVAKIGSVFNHNFFGNNAAVLHTQQAQNGSKRLRKGELKGRIIQRFKTLFIVYTVVKDPRAAAGSGGVNKAVKAVFNIKSGELAAFSVWKGVVIVKKYVGAQVKGINFTIIRYIPAVCQRPTGTSGLG